MRVLIRHTTSAQALHSYHGVRKASTIAHHHIERAHQLAQGAGVNLLTFALEAVPKNVMSFGIFSDPLLNRKGKHTAEGITFDFRDPGRFAVIAPCSVGEDTGLPKTEPIDRHY